MSFGQRIFEAMTAHGERPAILSGREQLSYADILAQADRLAANFAELGIDGGSRVGLAMQDTMEVALSILACWRLAATPVIIDFRAPRAQRARIVGDFGVAVALETRSPPGSETYPALRFDREWRFSAKRALPSATAVDCSNPAFLLLSSGTTGDPKAYVQTHDALAARVVQRRAVMDSAEMRFLTPMTLSYSASRHQVLAYLFFGGTVSFFPPLFTPSELTEALLAFRASGSALPPPVIARLAREAGERPSVLFPALGSLYSIGGPATAEEKIAAYRNLSRGYRISYASSLTGMISVLAGEDVLAKPESSGRLVGGVRVEILDAGRRPLPPGERGLIKAYTGTMASAVLLPGNQPFVDPLVMGPDWGVPGDIGFLDGDGFLTIVDREGDMIVRGGVNIAPQELEKLIRAHPKVTDVAVAGFPDATMGQEIAAFVVSEAGMTADELRQFLAGAVAPDRRPRELRIVRALPYSDNGKLLRRKLVDMLVAERSAQSSERQ